MKSHILKVSAVICTMALIITAISTPSCKQPGNCTGNVTVYDSVGLPLANSPVKVYHPLNNAAGYTSPAGSWIYRGYTNSKGFVQFTIPLPAVYSVLAALPTDTNNVVKGVLILNNPGSTYNETLQFQ